MLLRARPAPPQFPTNILYTPLNNAPLHSVPSGWRLVTASVPLTGLLSALSRGWAWVRLLSVFHPLCTTCTDTDLMTSKNYVCRNANAGMLFSLDVVNQLRFFALLCWVKVRLGCIESTLREKNSYKIKARQFRRIEPPNNYTGDCFYSTKILYCRSN